MGDPFLPEEPSDSDSNERKKELLDAHGRSISDIEQIKHEERFVPYWYEDKHLEKAPLCRRKQEYAEDFGFEDIIKICADHGNKLPSEEELSKDGLSWVLFLIENEGGRK